MSLGQNQSSRSYISLQSITATSSLAARENDTGVASPRSSAPGTANAAHQRRSRVRSLRKERARSIPQLSDITLSHKREAMHRDSSHVAPGRASQSQSSRRSLRQNGPLSPHSEPRKAVLEDKTNVSRHPRSKIDTKEEAATTFLLGSSELGTAEFGSVVSESQSSTSQAKRAKIRMLTSEALRAEQNDISIPDENCIDIYRRHES